MATPADVAHVKRATLMAKPAIVFSTTTTPVPKKK